MKRTLLKHIMVSMTVLAASCAVLSAQDIKTVTGKIINTTTGRPFDPVTVMIMAYNTVGEAEDCRASLQSGVFPGGSVIKEPDDQGYYEISVAESGAIVIKIFAAGQCNGAVHGKRLQLIAKLQHRFNS